MVRHLFRAGSVSLVVAAVASAQTPVGGEFRVNTYVTGAQYRSHPAMGADGDFVVVWDSFAQDGDSDGVFGQRFAATGVPRGSEFRINTYTTGSQSHAIVAVGSGGNFVVVWQSAQDGSGSSIQARRYDAAGSPIGDEFLVNTFTTGSQSGAHVGRASDGRFVVGWSSPNDGSSAGIAARRFDASGNAVGSEFVVNTYTTGSQGLGGLAVEANGNFVAVWQDSSLNNRDGSSSAIFGQRYDASGNRLGSEFQVNTYTTGFQSFPSVSVSPAGGFVVAWTGPGDGSGYGLFSRRFDAAGNAVGNDFVVNTYTAGNQLGYFTAGHVAHDARGNFVVTWEGPGGGSSYDSFAQRFNASGARRGAEFRVNTYTAGPQYRPSVASDAVGNFVVAWNSPGQDGSSFGIFAQRFGDLIFEDGFDSTTP